MNIHLPQRKMGSSGIFIHPIGLGAWPLSKENRPIPIPGATKISSVLSSAAVMQFILKPKQLSELKSL